MPLWCDKDYGDLEEADSAYTGKIFRRKKNLHSVTQDLAMPELVVRYRVPIERQPFWITLRQSNNDR